MKDDDNWVRTHVANNFMPVYPYRVPAFVALVNQPVEWPDKPVADYTPGQAGIEREG